MILRSFLVVCSIALLSLSMVNGAEAKKGGGGKVDICHFDADAGLFSVINISVNAVDKHVANHGDGDPGNFFADVDGDGFGDPDGATDDCPNDGFVANSDDACPLEASEEDDGCPVPTLTVGSDLFIGQGGLHGHKVNIAMAFGDGAGGYTLDVAGLNAYEDNRTAVGRFNNDTLDDVVVTRSGGAVFVALGDFSDGM